MTTDELDRTLRQLRLGGMADTLNVRAQQARAEQLGPLDFLSLLVHDETQRRRDRLLSRRIKAANLRDQTTLDSFNWSFNPNIDRSPAAEKGREKSPTSRVSMVLTARV